MFGTATLLTVVFYILFSFGVVFAIDPKDMIRLDNAGIGRTVVEVIEKEKILETCVLSIEDIINLKKAGYTDENISTYLVHQSFMKNANHRIYKNYESSNRIVQADIKDMAYLKELGFSEDILKALISNQTCCTEDEQTNQILQMFKNMSIFLEIKTKDNGRNRLPLSR